MSVLEAIKSLTPTEFENFAFDLLQSTGMRQLIWRTPGSDGGRDIQGITQNTDFSGYFDNQVWYVECKRYSTSLSWPIVWEKIAYADNDNAHYLLIITNSNPSPTCETKISEWNSKNNRVKIRIWRGYDLERILQTQPQINIKYNLSKNKDIEARSFMPILDQIKNISQANYTSNSLGMNASAGIEAGAALADLASIRMEQIKKYGKMTPLSQAPSPPSYDWLRWDAAAKPWDDAGIRALLCMIRYGCGATGLDVAVSDSTIIVKPENSRLPATTTLKEALTQIAVWADIKISDISSAGETTMIAPTS